MAALKCVVRAVVPELSPEDRRHPGGNRFFSGLVQAVRIRPFVGFMLTKHVPEFRMFGYISNATYVLQGASWACPHGFRVGVLCI